MSFWTSIGLGDKFNRLKILEDVLKLNEQQNYQSAQIVNVSQQLQVNYQELTNKLALTSSIISNDVNDKYTSLVNHLVEENLQLRISIKEQLEITKKVLDLISVQQEQILTVQNEVTHLKEVLDNKLVDVQEMIKMVWINDLLDDLHTIQKFNNEFTSDNK